MNKRGSQNPIPSSNDDIYVEATIHFVDTENNVFDAISTDNLRFIKNCQYLEVNTDLSGEIRHPAAGNTCVIRISPGNVYHLEKIYTPTSVNSDGVPQINLGTHSKYMPGDRIFLAKGGAFLAILRNGLAKIGVTPICQMIFMKLENYTRWISRNIEIIASGFRFYSVNDNGKNITRLSIFLQDSMSNASRNDSSEASNFEICAKENSLSIMYGPVDPNTNLRNNTTMIDLIKTGALIFYFKNPDTGAIIRKVMYNPNGCSADTIYDGLSTDQVNVLYEKTINKVFDGQKYQVSVLEEMSGDYTVKVDGSYHITAKNDVQFNGHNVFSYAAVAHGFESKAHMVKADVKS